MITYKLVTLNPKLKSTGAGRYQASFTLVGCLPQRLVQDFSRKVRTACSALQQIKERGALPMIDRGDIVKAIDRCSNIWASLPGAGYGQFERHKDDWPDCRNSKKRAERSSCRRSAAVIPALVICIIVCLSWAVNRTKCDNAITYKAQRQNVNWSWRTWHSFELADASAWCCTTSMQNTRRS